KLSRRHPPKSLQYQISSCPENRTPLKGLEDFSRPTSKTNRNPNRTRLTNTTFFGKKGLHCAEIHPSAPRKLSGKHQKNYRPGGGKGRAIVSRRCVFWPS